MQPEKNKLKYDVIVLGAGVPGVFYALEQRALGNDVLLVNKYGFPGGYVTESLSLLQMFEKEDLHPRLTKWLENLDEDGILFNVSTSFIFNPEAVKISLLKLLEENGVDILFHVFPKGINIQKPNNTKLVLWGKEGRIEAECDFLFDATENFILNSFFESGENKPTGYRTNIITTEIMREKVVEIEGSENVYQLSDGRCYMQFPFEVSNPDFFETDAQKKLDTASKLLKKKKCRIQVVPPQSEIVYEIKPSKYYDMFEEYFDSFYLACKTKILPSNVIALTDQLLKQKFM